MRPKATKVQLHANELLLEHSVLSPRPDEQIRATTHERQPHVAQHRLAPPPTTHERSNGCRHKRASFARNNIQHAERWRHVAEDHASVGVTEVLKGEARLRRNASE